MFYRVAHLQFEEERFSELADWAENVRPRVEAVDGLRFADLARTGPGEGMIVAGYDDEDSFQAAAETIARVLGEMAEFLTGPTQINAGTVAISFVRQTDAQ
jgi:hypothetical protein